jgi:L-ascorbate metabolism protein UlaG (beta-lactamase superfamily)
MKSGCIQSNSDFFKHIMLIKKKSRLFFLLFLTICCMVIITGCNSFIQRFVIQSITQLPLSPDTISGKIEHPIYPQIGLSILWVGHSTYLIQIGEKVFLTDPKFMNTAGMISKRRIEPGIKISSIDRLDYILISHLHFDHLCYGSLSLLPKSAILLLPPGGIEYVPEFGFSEYREMNLWSVYNADGLQITAVPAKHFKGRYGFDVPFLEYDTFVGYIIEYQGKTVFFAGDTAYDDAIFKNIGRKFSIDVALIPIAPIEPRNFMKRIHTDPNEAIQIFKDCRARIMIPMHHRTFVQGTDSSLTFAEDRLRTLIFERQMEDRVMILRIGEQRVIIP